MTNVYVIVLYQLHKKYLTVIQHGLEVYKVKVFVSENK